MFASEEMINIINDLVDQAEAEIHLTHDQATVFAMVQTLRTFMVALGEKIIAEGRQNDPVLEIPTHVLNSFVDLILWGNDRLEISMLSNEI